MQYDLFLFDLDDTLLDFKESERLSFFSSMQDLGLKTGLDDLFARYQVENHALWKLFEKGETTKEHLKIERFRRIFTKGNIDIDPELASTRYLDRLPETVVLIDHAEDICEHLSHYGEIGIVTNGISTVQTRRIANSKLASYISFISVSEDCGFAKPDTRFFEYSARMAKKFAKASSLVIGDRLETDIQGAHNFGVDSCWFNPGGLPQPTELPPRYDIRHLSEIRTALTA